MRVIAGQYKGRRLMAPRGVTTRPTADKVREALFQILGDLSGLRVLDCFAGSGALGIEALSRGATHVTFIEADRAAASVIASNLQNIGAVDRSRILVRKIDRCRGIFKKTVPLDLVLADPPWSDARRAAESVAELVSGALGPRARVVLGHRSRQPVELPAASGLALYEQRQWGDSGLSFFRNPE